MGLAQARPNYDVPKLLADKISSMLMYSMLASLKSFSLFIGDLLLQLPTFYKLIVKILEQLSSIIIEFSLDCSHALEDFNKVQ